MDSKVAFQKILKSYEQYYSVSTENVTAPFAAEAVFKSHNEHYMLVKAAKIADIDSNEFVFFYINDRPLHYGRGDNQILNQSDHNNASTRVQNDNQFAQRDEVDCHFERAERVEKSLSAQKITELSKIAWERGISRVSPYYGHRNTDITLILLSERFSEESFTLVKKLKFYKSYKFGLFGWSAFRALAYETSTGRAVTNRRGSDLRKLVANLQTGG